MSWMLIVLIALGVVFVLGLLGALVVHVNLKRVASVQKDMFKDFFGTPPLDVIKKDK